MSAHSVGLNIFMDGLRSMDFQPASVPTAPDAVVFDYVVQSGKFAGKPVRIGLLVPADFPNTPPTGPHVSPHIHPVGGGGAHPTGGIHESHSAPFLATGGQWQYWSRPIPNWAQEKKSVGVYMSHIWRLWDTQ